MRSRPIFWRWAVSIDAVFRSFPAASPCRCAAPGFIPVALEYRFIAKALERTGDHAKNIAEFLVVAVEGRDVRRISLDELE
ncbi:PhoU domain-containing protein [Caballeronia arvi]|uniref:PhoU domain-containing protein n=1 Tax=Caballeronia arvi TaxID=1777135 RepID=UPI0007725317|nr:PhoU domain-containing protein [Caballeronia arvi]